MRYSTVLFDLDGTLTDPSVGICTCIRYALEKAGRPVKPNEYYYKYIGPPLLRSFEVFENATPEEAQELLAFYRERFSETGLFENEVIPGIPELLRDLKAQGLQIAVATGKPTVFAARILDHFGLTPYIDYLSGIALNGENTEKCQIIAQALYALGVKDKSRAVMIGDRSHDAVGAKMTHTDFIGVLYGFGNREELESEGVEMLAEDVETLRALLLQP